MSRPQMAWLRDYFSKQTLIITWVTHYNQMTGIKRLQTKNP